jgi:hypothetical protein
MSAAKLLRLYGYQHGPEQVSPTCIEWLAQSLCPIRAFRSSFLLLDASGPSVQGNKLAFGVIFGREPAIHRRDRLINSYSGTYHPTWMYIKVIRIAPRCSGGIPPSFRRPEVMGGVLDAFFATALAVYLGRLSYAKAQPMCWEESSSSDRVGNNCSRLISICVKVRLLIRSVPNNHDRQSLVFNVCSRG